MSRFTIGILGGMGPRATVEFEQRLIQRFTGNNQAIPRIITINNGRIPDRSSFLLRKGHDPLIELRAGADLLRSVKVDVVCMPCNTAHSAKILARLMAMSPLPIIDMPAACMLKLEAQDIKSVIVLGTAGTALSQLFDSRAISCACLYPDELNQRIVDEIIRTIKSGKKVRGNTLEDLIMIVKDSGAQAVLLACTELSLLPSDIFRDMLVIDSLDALAERCYILSEQGGNHDAR